MKNIRHFASAFGVYKIQDYNVLYDYTQVSLLIAVSLKSVRLYVLFLSWTEQERPNSLNDKV